MSKTEEAFKRQRDASEHGGGSTSLERASDLRTFYFTERLYSWRIVQELLRIDRDPTHPDFNFASEFISNYMTPDKLVYICDICLCGVYVRGARHKQNMLSRIFSVLLVILSI